MPIHIGDDSRSLECRTRYPRFFGWWLTAQSSATTRRRGRLGEFQPTRPFGRAVSMRRSHRGEDGRMAGYTGENDNEMYPLKQISNERSRDNRGDPEHETPKMKENRPQNTKEERQETHQLRSQSKRTEATTPNPSRKATQHDTEAGTGGATPRGLLWGQPVSQDRERFFRLSNATRT